MSEIESTMTPSIAALVAALAKAQGAMTGAAKSAENPHFKNKYADLASIWDAVRGPLSANGLAAIQTTEHAQGGVVVVTLLAHSSGEWIRSRLYMPAQKQDAQGFGSAITYARRYALAAICGIAPEDDDGNGAVERGRDERPAQQQRPPVQNTRPASAGKATLALADQAKKHAEAMKVAAKIPDVDAIQAAWLEAQKTDYGAALNARLEAVYNESLEAARAEQALRGAAE